MKEKNTITRSRWIHLRLRPEEHEKLMQKYHSTTCRKVSEFVRNCLFEKPITILQRNASLDTGLQELTALREELRAIGQNLNQVTHKVNANPLLATDSNWQASFTVQRQSLDFKIEELLTSLNTLAQTWLL
ncbi:plasmid mobilization protein [Flavobacterium psychrotrophum]|uniref:plasmid mobilization protein n=1 Tax=Flavobacterium psychrotrophum TaxID=2294119 RepID=UPI000E3199DB|nr:plasmid mobilization relaxosome protein MobC [Flavobacterium psychrotrophum]